MTLHKFILLVNIHVSYKVSTLLREKLGLSRKVFDEMLDCGIIRSNSGVDLKKGKLNYEIMLDIGKEKQKSSN